MSDFLYLFKNQTVLNIFIFFDDILYQREICQLIYSIQTYMPDKFCYEVK